MTTRQPKSQPETKPKTRPRRANGEGTNPHLRADGRYQIYVRYIDADGEPGRVSIYGETRDECREKAADFRRQVAQSAVVAKRNRGTTLGDAALEWRDTTLAVDNNVGDKTKTLYAGMVRKHIVNSALHVRVGSRSYAFGQLPVDKLMPKHIELWLLSLRREKDFEQLSTKVKAQITALQDADEDEEAERIRLRSAKGLSDSTVRIVLSVLRRTLAMAVRDHMVPTNKALEVAAVRITDREEAGYLSPAEVKELLAVVRNGVMVHPEGGKPYLAGRSRFAPYVELLVNTGLRRGEGIGLRWSDIDFEQSTLRVCRTVSRHDGKLFVKAPKTVKSRRTVPLTPAAVRVLKEVRARKREERLAAGSLWQQNDYVFTSEIGTLCEPRNALRAMESAGHLIGRPEIGVHTLRHTFATTMLSANVPLKVVSELLGHSSIAITADLYQHVSPDVSHHAMAQLSAALA